MPIDPSVHDPYLWLEEVDGAEALAWVAERNRATHAALAEKQPGFDALRERLRAAFDAEDRIPHLTRLGDRYYNFRQDEENPRGVWRRTTLEEYRKPAPDWEVVLDFDALGRAEGERWMFAGAPVLVPGYDRALVRLSRGGADAVVVREFDLVARRFVEEGGFALAESKGHVSWAGPNEVFVATDFGPGTMTDSGYPRIVKLWRRGQPLDEAATVFEGETSDVSVRAWADLAPGFETELVCRGRDFFNEDRYIRRAGELIPLDVPSDAGFAAHRGRLFVAPRADWETDGCTFPAGSLLAIGLDRFLAGARDLAVLFAPADGRVLAGFSPTRDHVLVNILDNVRHRIEVATPGAAAAGWSVAPLQGSDDGAGHFRSIDARAVDADADDRYFLVTEDLVRRGVATPERLGILGGSNGGLLMGNMLTMRPDLFGAVVAHVPLFDMRRYHRLHSGASWMAEYGDPEDPGDWAFLRTFSPYHNVEPGAAYPKLLVTTSTRDDRVHPGHARKMAAKMQAMGHEVLYHENVEGGHAGAADNAQRAYLWALVFRFLRGALAPN